MQSSTTLEAVLKRDRLVVGGLAASRRWPGPTRGIWPGVWTV